MKVLMFKAPEISEEKLIKFVKENFKWSSDYNPEIDFNGPAEFGGHFAYAMMTAITISISNMYYDKDKTDDLRRDAILKSIIGAYMALHGYLESNGLHLVVTEGKEAKPPLSSIN